MSWRGCTTWFGGGGPGIRTAFHWVRFTLPLVGGVGTSRRTYGLPCAATYIEFPCESCSSQAGWPAMVTAPKYLTLLAGALVREWVIEAMFRPASSWGDCSAGSTRYIPRNRVEAGAGRRGDPTTRAVASHEQ